MIMILTLFHKILALKIAPGGTLCEPSILRAIFKAMLWHHWWCHYGQNGFIFHNLPSSFHIWSQVEAKTWILEIHENSFDIWPWQSFKLKPKLKLECVKKMPRESQIMTIHVFVSTLYDKNWSSYSSFEDLTYFLTWWCYRWCHGYVTHNLHSQLPPPIFLQNIVRVAPVLHRAILWTNIVTNTLHENMITSLLWVIITVKFKVHQIPPT